MNQLSTGRIVAICQVHQKNLHRLNLFNQVNKLQGNTDDGWKFKLEHPMVIEDRLKIESRTSRTLTVIGRQLTVSKKSLPRTDLVVRFTIANLTLEKNLMIKVGGTSVKLERLSDYDAVINNLKGSRGVDVTCQATANLSALERRDHRIRIMDDLCLLLTLARGTWVTWIGYSILKKGNPILHYHRDAVTKPFSGVPLVAKFPATDTSDYLRKTCKVFRREDKRWELQKAIEGYTDAKMETDYLESRALKVAVTMEHLKARYLTRTKKTTIIIQSRFKEKGRKLKTEVRLIMTQLFPNVGAENLELMTNHTLGMNWYPFGRAIAEVCKEVGLNISSKERRQFKEIRDQLVHAMSFHPDHGKPSEQYFFMVTFVGKVLLAILKYDGYFYDWTKEPGWEGIDSPMRVKLDLVR